MTATDRLFQALMIAFGGTVCAIFFVVFVGSLLLATQPETDCETNIEWSFK